MISSLLLDFLEEDYNVKSIHMLIVYCKFVAVCFISQIEDETQKSWDENSETGQNKIKQNTAKLHII